MRSLSFRRLATTLVVTTVATAATAVLAQRGQSRDPDWQPRIWVGGGRFYRDPPRWAKPSDSDGQWNYCRGFYDSNEYFDRFSPDGYATGVNIVLYGLTH